MNTAAAENDREAGDGKAEFGAKLEHLIKERGLTNAAFKQQLAATHRIHPTTVDSWLHGNSMPRQRALAAVADILGVEIPVLTMPLSDLGEKLSFIGAAAPQSTSAAVDPVRGGMGLAGEDGKSRQFIGTYRIVAAEGGGVGKLQDGGHAGLEAAELTIKVERASGLLTFKCSGGVDTVSGYVHLSDTCLSLVGTAKPSGDFVTIMLDKFPAAWGRGSHMGLYCAPSQIHRGQPVARPIAIFMKDMEVGEGVTAALASELKGNA